MQDYKGYVIAGVLVTLWILESIVPHFEHQVKDRRLRLLHDGRNLLIGGINGLLGVVILTAAAAFTANFVEKYKLGILNQVNLPTVWATAAGIVFFDLWMYAWHRLNHRLPFLWRFHRMHHSDPALDATSALRFHPGEVVLSGFFRLIIMAVVGLSLWQLAVYELILFPIIMLHHSNVEFPERLDRSLRWLIVTPSIHWVHHSRLKHETNSNYGSVFSFWDRLFRTLRRRLHLQDINYGLDGYDESKRQSVKGLLKTPLWKD